MERRAPPAHCRAVHKNVLSSRPVLTRPLIADKCVMKKIPTVTAVADDMGSFDSVRLPPHFAQDDNKFESESGCIKFFPID